MKPRRTAREQPTPAVRSAVLHAFNYGLALRTFALRFSGEKAAPGKSHAFGCMNRAAESSRGRGDRWCFARKAASGPPLEPLGRRNRVIHRHVRARAVTRWVLRDAGRGGTHGRAVERAAPPRDPRRFHNASTATFRRRLSASAMADVPLRKRTPEDGRCPARTGDLLLVRREHLLRSTAVCRSGRSASDGPHRAAAVCCGLSLPRRFHKR